MHEIQINPVLIIFGILVIALVVRLAMLLFGPARPLGGRSDRFEAVALLNRSERALLPILDSVAAELHGPTARVFVQVSYGEFLRANSPAAFARINQKRADFVVADDEGRIILVVEYQGRGHYGKSSGGRSRAEASDRTKREALASAGIPLVEIPAKFDRPKVLEMVRAVDLVGGTASAA